MRREWPALTGGPVSFSWGMARTLGRVAFAVAEDGTASPLSVLSWALTTPTPVGCLAVVAVERRKGDLSPA